MTNLNKLNQVIQEWLREKRVGSVTINFFKGGISNILIKQSIKLEELQSS